jgi:hypothetical protein
VTFLIGSTCFILLVAILAAGARNRCERAARWKRMAAVSDKLVDYSRGLYVGDGIPYRVFVLDAPTKVWHQAKRLYPDGTYCMCLVRVPVERVKMWTYAKSLVDLKWKHRATSTIICSRCFPTRVNTTGVH